MDCEAGHALKFRGNTPVTATFFETEHEVVDFTGTPTLSHIKAMQSWISAMHVLLRGVSLLSVQVTRWGEWRVRSAGCAAGSLEIRRAGVVVPKWNDDSDRSCEFLGKTLRCVRQ